MTFSKKSPMRFRSVTAILFVVLATCFSGGTVKAGLINGDFEAGSYDDSMGRHLPNSWSFSGLKGANGVKQNGEFPIPGTPNGTHFFGFGESGKTATLSQDATGLVAGHYYEISFLYEGYKTFAAGINIFDVRVGGVSVFDALLTPVTPANKLTTGWKSYTSQPFVVSGDTLDVTFLGRSDPGWINIDQVVLKDLDAPSTAVPEPSSLVLTALGGIGLAFGATRRRRSASV